MHRGGALRYPGGRVDELVQWLGEQLDIDTVKAKACPGSGEWSADDIAIYAADLSREVREHMAEHDPARVLREIDAKRALLRRANGGVDYPHTHPGEDDADHLSRHHDDGLLRLLALPYADRPGYKPKWRP